MKFSSLVGALAILFAGCSERVAEEEALFETVPANVTNIDFRNRLIPTEDLNIMTYLYYFNGGGVASADFNNDGRVDLFFTANNSPCRLFLNEGDWRFRDVTSLTGIETTGEWSTGVSLVDINNDGLTDIYVNQVGNFRDFKGRNRLFVCTGVSQGIPAYVEAAADYGLDFSGLATQSLFFDYDLDGDLDLYQLNHSVHENGTFGERKNFLGKTHETAGDRLFRNDEGVYTDVTAASGIHSMVIGYGLGIAAGDVNNDGLPDLYVGNDFHENDYLYINQGDGTFREMLGQAMLHTSRFSMGVDIADFNNDAFNDVISLDMLPYDPVVLKSSLGEDEYSAFNFKLSYGYQVQFARNNLQLNNGDSTFSEIGMFSGVHATDWSWASLFLDFDNDGMKDLFVTNGIPARMNDIDYVNFRSSNEDHRWKTQGNRMEPEDLEIVKMIPEIRIPNRFFLNSGNLQFKDVSARIKDSPPTCSNGAVYADIDGDGDFDIVTNNIDDDATVYRNLTSESKNPGKNFISLNLRGPEKNRDAIGARVIVYCDSARLSFENFPVRGFQSCMLGNVMIGVGDTTAVDSILVIWPDRSFEKIKEPRYNRNNVLEWKEGLPSFDYSSLSFQKRKSFVDRTATSSLPFRHVENNFVEFDRERLMPFMVSREGPALAVGDVNNDGLDDFFIGSAKWESSKIFMQTEEGKFYSNTPEIIWRDSIYEDVDAVFVDLDNDNDLDLVVASGGNEFWGDSPYLRQRFYLNDGNGTFSKRSFFPGAFMTASCVLPNDFNNDGLVDFFIGGRAVPKSYGLAPSSYFFKNVGNGKFEDVSETICNDLGNIGMVTDGAWADLDGDGKDDLVLTIDWGKVVAMMGRNEGFEVVDITRSTGLWGFIYPIDGDQDGDIDLIVGNMGLNSRFEVNEDQPLRLYVNDFDDNGQVEQILTYLVEGREVPFASHAELTKQLPSLKKKFLYAKDFSNASISDLFGIRKLQDSKLYEVNNLANTYLKNDGSGKFEEVALPDPLQFSSLRAATSVPTTETGESQLIVAGNFFENNVDMGWYDASYGNLMRINSNGSLIVDRRSLGIRGQVRNARQITILGHQMFILVRNNDSIVILERIDSQILP